MSKPSQASERLILVEGKDDREVLHHLLTHYRILKGTLECKACEGKNLLLAEFTIRLKKGDLDPVGIVIDADNDLRACWDSLRNILSQAGYAAVPKEPLPEGVILRQEEKPPAGLWIMPNNSLPGMLEDFVSHLVPRNDSLWSRAETCVNGIPLEQRPFKDKLAKAHIHIKPNMTL